MGLLAYALVGGALYGVFFSLAAIGLNLVFGVMRMINLAHGQFILFGGFGAWVLYHDLKVNPIFGVPLAIIGARRSDTRSTMP
jgi:branched-chain amino acid transport system permease protein